MNHVFITGANRGIGFALTHEFLLTSDDYIFVTYRSPDSSQDLLSLADAHPDRITPIRMDVTDSDHIRDAVSTVKQHTPKLDLLINNAGMLIQEANFSDISADNLLKTFKTNVLGVLLVTQNLLELLRLGNNARIINISSEAGSISTWEKTIIGSYAISKSALNMLTKITSVQLQDDNIITVAVHPGNIKTDMGPENDTPPETCAKNLIALIQSLQAADNGRYMRWDKTPLEW